MYVSKDIVCVYFYIIYIYIYIYICIHYIYMYTYIYIYVYIIYIYVYIYIYIYIYMVAQKKHIVQTRIIILTCIYSVLCTFWPLDLNTSFGGSLYIQYT